MSDDERKPDWFALLRYCQEYGGRYGLTLPFIIGACRTRSSQTNAAANFDDLRQLLVSMRDHVSETRYVLINECNMLRQPVAALGYTQFRSSGYVEVRSPKHDFCSLLIQPQYAPDEAGTVDSVVERLWHIHQTAISNGRFSRRNDEYHPFDDRDRHFIEMAFNMPCDEPE